MDILLSIGALALALVGIVGCVVPVIPGVVLGYVGLLCAWCTSYSHLSTSAVWIWLAVTVIVTAADYFLPGWMTRRFGGSRAGAMGATVGVIAGLFFVPWGVVFGPFIGAVAGELLNDRTDSAKAFRVGFGSFMAFIVGTGLKLAAAIGMFILILADTWAPFREWVGGLF